MPAPPVVLDWDGTVTEVDGLHLVLEQFGDLGVYHDAERRLGRELSLHEVIALEFSTIHAPLDEVLGWVRENVRIRRGFAEFAARFRPRVVSSGFHELIDVVLEREGVELEVRANHLAADSAGWHVIFRNEVSCEVCGEACKRADLDGLHDVVYVGDGFSDRCVALAASRVFARDGLARYLDERGVPFEPFTDFVALEESLLGPGLTK